MFVRHLLSLSAALFLLHGIANADCDQSLSGQSLSRSQWAKSFEVSHPQDSHLSIKSLKKAVVSKVELNSLAANDEQFLKVISDLESWMVHPEDLPSSFTQNELILYFEERLDLIKKGIEELDSKLKLSAPGFEVKFSENWTAWYKKMETATRNLRGKSGDLQVAAQAKELFNLEMGVLTEIRSAFSFEGIDDLGITISKNIQISDDLQMAIWELEEAVQKDPRVMVDAIAKNPFIFKTPYYTYQQKKVKFPHLSSEELLSPIAIPEADYLEFFSSPINTGFYLTKIQKWILTKEIDLVRHREDGTICWIEVKRNREVEDLSRFTLKINGRKSHFEQILEDLNIIKLIGKEGLIKVQYYSSSGVTAELRTFLEQYGVEVL